jgi:bifunctional UDP-N-acetylglucosamine pyrophosphorylase/glucosamine-1-phosphate N-acetyltransferase
LIRTNASIGKDVCVGFGVEVKNSVLLDGSHIGRLSYIGDSFIGEGIQFGAGTQTQNIQPNKTPIQMQILDQKFTLPIEKFGVMLGDNSVLGINISINAGIRIGDKCTIAPSTYIDQDIPSKVRVSEQRKLIISPEK